MSERFPYPGLRPFDEEDAPIFFGRETLVNRLVGAVQNHPFVAIIGASGVGKTSVLRAGLIPALRSRVPNIRPVYLRPFEPLRSLAAAFRLADSRLQSVEERKVMDRIHAGSALEFAQFLKAHDHVQETALIVDQFEELYTLAHEPRERESFVALLMAIVDVSAMRVVISVRSDFISEMIIN